MSAAFRRHEVAMRAMYVNPNLFPEPAQIDPARDEIGRGPT